MTHLFEGVMHSYEQWTTDFRTELIFTVAVTVSPTSTEKVDMKATAPNTDRRVICQEPLHGFGNSSTWCTTTDPGPGSLDPITADTRL